MSFFKASKTVLGTAPPGRREVGYGPGESSLPKMLRPVKLDRNSNLVVKRRQSRIRGRSPHLSCSDEPYTYSFSSDPEKQAQFTEHIAQDVGVQNVPYISLHDVNTESIDFTSGGMRHVEGGWPKDVSASEEDQKLRFRKKIEKDEYFIHSVLQLSTKMEHCIRQNSSVDIYEGYFDGYVAPIVEDDQPVKTVNVIRDPLEGRMITDLSYSAASSVSTKIAAAYSSSLFMGLSQGTRKESFIWDINTSSSPETTLRGPSWLHCIQFNPKDQNVVGAGCQNGQICYWDIRAGSKPQDTTHLKVSHTDIVTSFSWLVHKNKYELFTISIDGQVLWWDTRKLTEPTDRLLLIDPETTAAVTATSLEHEPSMPTKFMVGTEQGKVVACNRRARSAADKIGLCYQAHLSPVYSVQRNPVFQKNFLTVGDWTMKVWTEDFKESPILWTTPSDSQLRCGCWSPTRPSTAFTASSSGVLHIWDFLESWAVPSISVQVADEGLETVKVHQQGQMVATGSQKGTVTLVRLPDRLWVPFNKHEKPSYTALLERETRRERVLEARHKEQRLREKAKGAQHLHRKEVLQKTDVNPIKTAEEEYINAVNQMKAQIALEEAAVVEVTPAPDDTVEEDIENYNSDIINHLQQLNDDSEDPRSFSSGDAER